MKGTTLARVLGAVLRTRDEVSLPEAVEVLRVAFGEESLSSKRARAGRAGGQRSAAVRAEVHGTAQPKHPPNQTRSNGALLPEAPTEPNPKQNALASDPGRPSAPLIHPVASDPDPERSIQIAVVSEGSVSSPRAANVPGATTPTDFESAMRETVAVRCALARADVELARRCDLNRWPEVVQVTTAWHAAKGLPGAPRLRKPGEDADVNALLDLLALEYEPDHLERIARHLAKHPKFAHLALLRAVLKLETVQIAETELATAQPRRSHDPAPPPRREPTRAELRAEADAASDNLRKMLAHEHALTEPIFTEDDLAKAGAAE